MKRAALLTPPGTAAIAVIRVIGSDLLSLIQTIFRPAHPAQAIAPDRLILGSICDQNNQIDQVILHWQNAPSHQILDINCHGGPRIVQRLLLLLEKHQIALVSWRELITPQAIADEVMLTLPLALTELAARAIAFQHPGGLTAWTRHAIRRLAQTPHAADEIQNEIADLLPTFALTQKLLYPAHVLILGAPNVGKSTLANALTGQNQSIVTPIPGTTRDWTAQTTSIHGVPICLIDTAGCRDTLDPLEQAGIAQIQTLLPQTQLILYVHDITHPQSLPLSLNRDIPILHIFNKADLLPAPPQPRVPGIVLSARNPLALDPLRLAMIEALGFASFSPTVPLLFTARQYDLLTAAGRETAPHDLRQLLTTL